MEHADEHGERADSGADVSTSGTDIYLFCRGERPKGVKVADAAMPEPEEALSAEIEVDGGRYSAIRRC